ncbi:MAG: EamA family transporter RarD [Proteobacteria bacterium]|nr:EamA family transporter RarD [Pseudomonadota bacterium]
MSAKELASNRDQTLVGALSASTAFLVWGGYPIYFKALDRIPAVELMCHRVVWSVAVLALALACLRRLDALLAALANRRLLAMLALTGALIALNWVTYIWAVLNDRVLEASLGYYVNPLMNVALGVVVLRERLSARQAAAVLLAAAGVAALIVRHGAVPWAGLLIALSFSVYGLIRKLAMVDAFTGLMVETAILFLPALAYLVAVGAEGSGAFARQGPAVSGLLAFAGILTTLPLVLFAQAAKRLRYATVGFFHYITPTCLFLLAVFAYGEPITGVHLLTFGLIWAALALYTLDSLSLAPRATGRA